MIAVGVDTHKHEHLARALDGLGGVLGGVTIKTNLAGYLELADWLAELGEDVVVGIEGAGSFGAGLCEFLLAQGIEVMEVERPRREDRRRGKSDAIDALAAAKKVLAGDGLSIPRAGGSRQALGALLVAYRSCVAERTRLLKPAAVASHQCAGCAARADRARRRQAARCPREQDALALGCARGGAGHPHGAARPRPPQPRAGRPSRDLRARAHPPDRLARPDAA